MLAAAAKYNLREDTKLWMGDVDHRALYISRKLICSLRI